MSLCNNPALTIARFSRYTPVKIEEISTNHRKCADRLDTLQSSKKFYLKDYKGAGKYLMLQQIVNEIKSISKELEDYPKPITMGEQSRLDLPLLETSLQLLINDLREFFQVDNMISTKAIINLCPLIIYEYPSLTLEEIAICFAQAKKGHYEQLYNRLDSAIIMGWIKQYNAEKLDRLRESNYVRDAHAKIGLNEGRSNYKGSHAQLVGDAYTMLANEKTKKRRP